MSRFRLRLARLVAGQDVIPSPGEGIHIVTISGKARYVTEAASIEFQTKASPWIDYKPEGLDVTDFTPLQRVSTFSGRLA